jgi:hypothetical protein
MCLLSALWANYDKYETIKDVAEAIGFEYSTASNWVAASKKLSPKIREIISSADGLTHRGMRPLVKYAHGTQERLAKTIIPLIYFQEQLTNEAKKIKSSL